VYDGEWTIGSLLATRAEQQPDREIVRFEDEALTYGILDETANRVANALSGLGLGKGDRVAVMLGNRPEYLGLWFGIARAGLVEVPLNTGLRGDMLVHMLNTCGCRLLVIDGQWLERVERVASRLETLEQVVVLGEGAVAGFECLPHELLLAGAAGGPDATVVPQDPSVILFTSGTTGPSKGAVLSHRANVNVASSTCALMDYGEDEVLFNMFPLYHVNARYTSVLPSMWLDRGTCVLHDRFSASRFWDICRAEGVTAFNFMGALVLMLFKQPERDDDADNPVRCAYGAPAPVAVLERFERRFGVELIEVYGSTELGACLQNRRGDRRIGSCGREAPHFIVEIHDEDDNPVGPGIEGEIVVRSREPHVMVEEYFGAPEETLVAFRNLWFHTGDRGRTDEDGWFYYVDRLKDAIRRRGENISSWEVEQVVNDHEAVAESAAIGIPSDLTEEEVMVVVVLQDDAVLPHEALLDFCQERLPHFAVPRYVRFTGELPKNHAQRIQKQELRAEAVTVDTWDREQFGYVVTR
jgi:crotonobetaine/carnitine-CoA ligase